jgi:hypothetical protein
MRDRLEAAFEYTIDHPEALMLLGGMFFAFVSIFTAPLDPTTTSYIRVVATCLLVAGVVLYVLHLGLRLIIRFFRRVFHTQPTLDGPPPPPPP